MRCSDRARTVGGCCAQTIDQMAERPSSPGTRGKASGHRLRTLGLASLLSAVATLCIAPAALALSQQGHSFELSFAKKGSAEGQLSSPSGVAVNEKTGDVYVVDSANNRVEVFGHKGEFIEVWGWGVKDGKSEFEICKQGEGLEGVCHPGIAGTGEGQFEAPEAIAVDNSTSAGDESAGDVYVVGETEVAGNALEKFGPNGERLGRLTTEEEGTMGGVAVDAKGGVWAYLAEETPVAEGFNNAAKNVHEIKVTLEALPEFGSTLCGRPGFAIDAAAHVFYADHERQLFGECPEAGIPSSAKDPAITAKLEREAGENVAESVREGLDAENSSAVAVDESSGKQTSGDVYVDNRTSIAAFDASGALVQRFGEGELSKGAGVAVDAATGEVYVADAAKDRIDVFKLNAEPGPPEINSVSARNESPTTTTLTAEIDPHGVETEYRFEYGTIKCPAPSCTVSSGKIEAGFGDREVHVQAQGLEPGTTYFYRVVAKNAKGEEAPPKEQELHTFTTLPNPAGLLADGRSWEMVSPPEKHGASPEPLGFGRSAPLGGIIESSEEGDAITYAANGPFEAEAEANRSNEGVQVISNRSPQGWSTHEIITPNEHGAGILAGQPQEYRSFTPDLSLALVEPLKARPEFPRFQEPPLVPQGPGVKEERGLYRRHNPTCLASPATCYEPLITTADNQTGEPFGGKLTYVAASSDLKHVIFSTEAKLTEDAPNEEGGLYEWNAGEPARLEYISLLPSKSGHPRALPEAALGDNTEGKSESDRNAISANGSRVFFSNEEGIAGELHEHLYMRDTEKNVTLEVNAPEKGVPHGTPEQEEKANTAEYQTANTEGSRVFFTDTVSLTAESKLRSIGRADPADLYVCEVEERPEGPACNLTDLTVDKHSNLGESAEVIGTMLGASENGSTIYFVANGVLAPGAVHGTCARTNSALTPPPGATCNLYKEQFSEGKWQEPQLVAVLSAEDQPDWARSQENPELFNQTARVSSNGDFLAFMSDRPLTGYDNQDINSGRPDEEVFLYDREHERVVCVSCNPSPEVRPTGMFDTQEAGEPQEGPLVDPKSGVWPGRWLAGSIPGWTPTSTFTNPYQSRYLLDNGRLFFNGADALVPHAVEHRAENAEGHQYEVGVENAYEYEPQGVGSCQQAGGCVSLISGGGSEHESAFLDASSSGSNVFFLTSQQLISSDHDSNLDVYDARECGEAGCVPPPPSPETPCSGESCRSVSPPSAPVYQPGATSTFSGPGNTGTRVVEEPKKTKTLTRKQKLAKAVALCRKRYKHSRRKRVVCERKANRAYGAKKASTNTKASAHKRGGKR